MRTIRIFAFLAFLAGGLAVYRLGSPYQGFGGETFVDIPHGTSTGTIAGMLADARVVRSRWDFLLARLAGRGRKLQAGEYRFDRAATPTEVYGRMARGDVFFYELAVPEGRNMFDIAASVEKLGIFPADQFLAAARDPRAIRDLDPRAPTLEGYLFPNTYHVGRHTTPEQLCRMMTGKFREVWRGLRAGANAHDAVTLASLVEKEDKLESERPLIAAVFANRLRIGMKLDCDPTTIYAALLHDNYRGTIYQSDLDRADPYNTYHGAGLPPGPIANPGVASLEAALHPAASEALYFVLRPDGSGAHQFSTNLAAHQQAAAKYHRGRRK
jgi:UPF0755 protein